MGLEACSEKTSKAHSGYSRSQTGDYNLALNQRPLYSAGSDNKTFTTKALGDSSILGKEALKDMGFEKPNDCILKQFENVKLNT